LTGVLIFTEIFMVLAKQGFIAKEFASDDLARMACFINRLVHLFKL